MKTTITLEEDVAKKARALVARSGRSMKSVVNEALRCGLDKLAKPASFKPYRTKARKMGLRPGRELDNIACLLSELEGEEAR